MTTKEDKIALVREGRAEFEKLELRLEEDIASIAAITAIISRGVPMEMLSGRRAMRINARLGKVRAAIEDVRADVYEIHADCTVIAQENGADGELPGGFVVFGGGSRP